MRRSVSSPDRKRPRRPSARCRAVDRRRVVKRADDDEILVHQDRRFQPMSRPWSRSARMSFAMICSPLEISSIVVGKVGASQGIVEQAGLSSGLFEELGRTWLPRESGGILGPRTLAVSSLSARAGAGARGETGGGTRCWTRSSRWLCMYWGAGVRLLLREGRPAFTAAARCPWKRLAGHRSLAAPTLLCCLPSRSAPGSARGRSAAEARPWRCRGRRRGIERRGSARLNGPW